MFIYIKLLNNTGTNDIQLEVFPFDKIQDIKSRLEKQLNIPINQQKLVLKGKPLHDGLLSDYQIIDGSKLHLMISSSNSTIISNKSINNAFTNELYLLASKWIRNPNEREIFVSNFQTEMKEIVDGLSLDDIEKICMDRLNQTV